MVPLIEVERKRALDADAHERVLGNLFTWGYGVHSEHAEVDDYYSRPDVDFMNTVECLRVRRRDGFAEVTYKPSSTHATTSATGRIAKQETNVILAGPDQAQQANQLLAMLGMEHLARVDKRRIEYRHEDQAHVTVAVDTISETGTFVEVEALSPDVDDGETVLERIECELGIADLPVVTLPYRDLVMQAA